MEHLAKKLINWASILEPGTREQALRTASMPFIWPHLALMPDAHLGKGATVGSVIPTLGAIMPAAVGVDIGCGMIAVRTGLSNKLSLNSSPHDAGREYSPEACLEVVVAGSGLVSSPPGQRKLRVRPQAASHCARHAAAPLLRRRRGWQRQNSALTC
jgi:tRNA-splicing ligase RtcB